MDKLWQCPRCKRKFERYNQSHSCNRFPLKDHFKKKPEAKKLYNQLKRAMGKIGPFKVESLPCCIHFFSTFTFAGVYIMKDKIRVSFSLPSRERSLGKGLRLSKHRYLYQVDIFNDKAIGRKLLGWLRRAYYIKIGN